jgi:hypothetical protein
MSAPRSVFANGFMLLRGVAKRPRDYGLDYPHGSLKNVLEFAIQHPDCVQDGGASANRELKRCREESLHQRSEAERIRHRIERELLLAKEALAWTELDHRLGVTNCFWNVGRYSRLVRHLCVLAALWRYWRRNFPEARPYLSSAAATRLTRLWQLRQRGWIAVQDHLSRCGVDWRAGVTARLNTKADRPFTTAGGKKKAVRQDRDGNLWRVNYRPEFLMNAVLASIFARLSGCPGTEICPFFLDYDPRNTQPCSVQPYIRAQHVPQFDSLSRNDLNQLIVGNRRRASQILCQAVMRWIVENNGTQVIVDTVGNCIQIDQERSFFIDDQRASTDWPAEWDAKSKLGLSVVRAELIEATARIPGVLDDLAGFVARVEAIPGSVYAGLVRNASFREEQLCSLFYLNTMGSGALQSMEVLERWTAHLLDRKSMVRAALLRRLSAVLGAGVSF